MTNNDRTRRGAGRLAVAWGLLALGELTLAARHSGHLGAKSDPIPDMTIINTAAAVFSLAMLGKNVKKVAEATSFTP